MLVNVRRGHCYNMYLILYQIWIPYNYITCTTIWNITPYSPPQQLTYSPNPTSFTVLNPRDKPHKFHFSKKSIFFNQSTDQLLLTFTHVLAEFELSKRWIAVQICCWCLQGLWAVLQSKIQIPASCHVTCHVSTHAVEHIQMALIQ